MLTPVHGQVPDDVDRAYLLARIQQRILERGKGKVHQTTTAS